MSTSSGRIRRHPPRNVKRKQRNRKKPNYRLLLKLFLLSIFVSGLGSYVMQTPALAVREVQIKGVRLTDKARVEEIAGSALGRNILLVDTSGISRRVRALHEVERVSVGRSLPGRVCIQVIERKPAAVIDSPDTRCMIQNDGLAFHAVDGPVAGVPTIQIASCGCVKEGRKVTSRCVDAALEAIKIARHESLPVAKISVDPIGDMCLNMEGGYYVKLGQPDEIARKMSMLRTVLVCKPSIAREAAYIDLSSPPGCAWKPKSS